MTLPIAASLPAELGRASCHSAPIGRDVSQCLSRPFVPVFASILREPQLRPSGVTGYIDGLPQGQSGIPVCA